MRRRRDRAEHRGVAVFLESSGFRRGPLRVEPRLESRVRLLRTCSSRRDISSPGRETQNDDSPNSLLGQSLAVPVELLPSRQERDKLDFRDTRPQSLKNALSSLSSVSIMFSRPPHIHPAQPDLRTSEQRRHTRPTERLDNTAAPALTGSTSFPIPSAGIIPSRRVCLIAAEAILSMQDTTKVDDENTVIQPLTGRLGAESIFFRSNRTCHPKLCVSS